MYKEPSKLGLLDPCGYVYCQMSFLGIKTKGGPFGVFQGDAQVVIWLILRREML